MSDKVQLIKQEIERRISQFEAKYPKDLGGYWNDEESAAYDCAEEYKRFLQFIDSFPEEPGCEVNFTTKSEDLEEEIERWIKEKHFIFTEIDEIIETARHFAEWQKQQMMKDAAEGEVVYQIGSAEIAPIDIRYKVVSDRVYIPNVKLGDKVKIIIIKSEQ